MDDFAPATRRCPTSSASRCPSSKIDRSFVASITHGGDDAAIVQGTIAPAHGLGRTVVAEGVETDAQLASTHSVAIHRPGLLVAWRCRRTWVLAELWLRRHRPRSAGRLTPRNQRVGAPTIQARRKAAEVGGTAWVGVVLNSTSTCPSLYGGYATPPEPLLCASTGTEISSANIPFICVNHLSRTG